MGNIVYEIEIQEILYKSIKLEAQSSEEAVLKAQNLYLANQITVKHDEFSEVTFRDISENKK